MKEGKWHKDLKNGKFQVTGKTGKVKIEEYSDGIKISGGEAKSGKQDGKGQPIAKKKKAVGFSTS